MAVEKKNFFQETLKDAGCAQNTIAEFLLFQAEDLSFPEYDYSFQYFS